jgi:hypothetical protein
MLLAVLVYRAFEPVHRTLGCSYGSFEYTASSRKDGGGDQLGTAVAWATM